MTAALVAGVDGVRSGWVAAVLGGAAVRWLADLSAAQVVGLLDTVDVMGIDVPIGLSAGPPRRADLEARGLLGPARSSVFLTAPVQAFWAALTQAGADGSLHGHRHVADAASRAAGGQGISAQAWGLADKIVSVERAVLAAGTDARDRVVEVHPECSFSALADALGRPRPSYGKRSAVGAARRAALLEAGLSIDVWGCLDDPVLAAVPADDALDALAAAWSARRWADRSHDGEGADAVVLGGEAGHCASDPAARLPARIVV